MNWAPLWVRHIIGTTFGGLLALALHVHPALAQRPGELQGPREREVREIVQTFAEYDARIRDAVDPAHRTEMESALQTIGRMRPGRERDAAMAGYRARFGKTHADALRRAAFDMASMERRLKVRYPNIRARIVDQGAIIIGFVDVFSDEPPAGGAATTAFGAANFALQEHKACGPLTSSSVSLGYPSFTAYSSGFGLATCWQSAYAVSQALPGEEGQTTDVEMRARHSWSLSVAAVGGGSHACASYYFETVRPAGGARFNKVQGAETCLLAVALWLATDSGEETATATPSVLNTGPTYGLIYGAIAYTGALGAGNFPTSSSGLTLLDTRLTVQ